MRAVDLKFDNGTLELVQSGNAEGALLPVEVLRAVRHRLTIIRAAPDLPTLRNWRSFGLINEETNDNVRSVQINDNWRMDVRFECDVSPIRATLLAVSSGQ